MEKQLENIVSKQMEENNKKFNKLIDSLLQRDVVNNTNQPQNGNKVLKGTSNNDERKYFKYGTNFSFKNYKHLMVVGSDVDDEIQYIIKVTPHFGINNSILSLNGIITDKESDSVIQQKDEDYKGIPLGRDLWSVINHYVKRPKPSEVEVKELTNSDIEKLVESGVKLKGDYQINYKDYRVYFGEKEIKLWDKLIEEYCKTIKN
jgi:hypothetical protein